MKLFLFSLAAFTAAATFASEPVAIVGRTVHTMAGRTLRDGVILIHDGKITAVGERNAVAIPDGVRTISAEVVTPGLVDVRATVGLSGVLNQPHDQEQIEKTAPIQPELRVVDSVNLRDPLVDWVRQFGVTTVHAAHAPGALVSGQSAVLKTHPANVEQATVLAPAMVTAALGDSALPNPDKAPGTKAKAVAMLRAELIKAREFARKREKAEEDKKPARDLKLETLADVLERKIPLVITAHRSQDILAALRLAAEFEFRLILDGASEAYLVLDRLKQSSVPVLLHPTMFRSDGEMENLSFTTASQLRAAGIPFAIQSGFEPYVPKTRVILFEAGLAAGHGLGFEPALASVTIDAAKILGVADRVGSLEVGKDGDVALYDGDPFEYATHCLGVVVAGEVLPGEPRGSN